MPGPEPQISEVLKHVAEIINNILQVASTKEVPSGYNSEKEIEIKEGV